MSLRTTQSASPAARLACAVVCVLLGALMLVSLSGCGEKRSVIEDRLRDDVAAIKHGDTALMTQYFGFNPAQGFDEAGISDEDFAALFFKSFNIEVTSVETHKGEGTVVATVTANDYERGLANYRATVTSWLAENGPMSSASDSEVKRQAALLYLQALSSADIEPRTTEVTLNYTLDGKVWVLQNPQVLIDAVFGNAFTDMNAGAIGTDTGVGASSGTQD